MKETKTESRGILQLIAYSARLSGATFYVIIGTLILAGVLEGLGMLSLFPLLQLVVTPGSQTELFTGKFAWVASAIQAAGVPVNLYTLVGVVVFGIVGKAIFLYFGMRLVTSAVSQIMANLRKELALRSLRARWAYFQTRPTGTLVNRLTNETYKAGSVFYYACQICANAIQVLVYALVSLYMSWKLTLAAGLGAAFIMLLLQHFVRVTRHAGRKQVQVLANISAKFGDFLQGIKPLKAMGMEDRLGTYLNREIETLDHAQQQELLAIETMKTVQEPVMVVLVAGLVLFCAAYDPGTLPRLLTMAVIFQRLLSRSNILQQNLQNCASGETAFWWVLDEIENAKAEGEASAPSVGGTLGLTKGIEVSDLRFSHGDTKVLKGLTLKIPARGLVVLNGPSGAGKTSFVDILCRLQKPDSGEILVDGKSLTAIPLPTWRNAVGYVPQEMFLLNDTLRNNLTLGDAQISEADIRLALELAGAADFVNALQRGLETPLGERGTALSGGQRQRISLARALLRKPELLILDEVTASLDPKTEEEICGSLLRIAESTCVIAISHQQAFVKKAELVYTLRDGNLEGPGA